MELAAEGHRVGCVNPGTVATGFFAAAAQPGAAWSWRPGRPLAPEQVARAILAQAAGRVRRRQYLPGAASLLVALAACWPALFEWFVRRRL
ncbi:MAG: hypothetical protein ACYTF0_02250 [Planctomycetota bacterium]|jgi:short-subunit dehydrogenase